MKKIALNNKTSFILIIALFLSGINFTGCTSFKTEIDEFNLTINEFNPEVFDQYFQDFYGNFRKIFEMLEDAKGDREKMQEAQRIILTKFEHLWDVLDGMREDREFCKQLILAAIKDLEGKVDSRNEKIDALLQYTLEFISEAKDIKEILAEFRLRFDNIDGVLIQHGVKLDSLQSTVDINQEVAVQFFQIIIRKIDSIGIQNATHQSGVDSLINELANSINIVIEQNETTHELIEQLFEICREEGHAYPDVQFNGLYAINGHALQAGHPGANDETIPGILKKVAFGGDFTYLPVVLTESGRYLALDAELENDYLYVHAKDLNSSGYVVIKYDRYSNSGKDIGSDIEDLSATSWDLTLHESNTSAVRGGNIVETSELRFDYQANRSTERNIVLAFLGEVPSLEGGDGPRGYQTIQNISGLTISGTIFDQLHADGFFNNPFSSN